MISRPVSLSRLPVGSSHRSSFGRLNIARALFHSPALLLCDEPTGNLDTDTGREVIELFGDINRTDGVTLLIVTHEERVSNAAGRVIRISDGLIDEAPLDGSLQRSPAGRSDDDEPAKEKLAKERLA